MTATLRQNNKYRYDTPVPCFCFAYLHNTIPSDVYKGDYIHCPQVLMVKVPEAQTNTQRLINQDTKTNTVRVAGNALNKSNQIQLNSYAKRGVSLSYLSHRLPLLSISLRVRLSQVYSFESVSYASTA